MWYITKDKAHWNRSTTILDAWGTSLTSIIGTDTSLLIGLEGVMFANAAEIMRWEGGWVEQGAIWYGGSGFSNQLYWLFARQSIIIGQANYGMISIGALLAFSVYLDDVSMVFPYPPLDQHTDEKLIAIVQLRNQCLPERPLCGLVW
jgi:hypothetical protein